MSDGRGPGNLSWSLAPTPTMLLFFFALWGVFAGRSWLWQSEEGVLSNLKTMKRMKQPQKMTPPLPWHQPTPCAHKKARPSGCSHTARLLSHPKLQPQLRILGTPHHVSPVLRSRQGVQLQLCVFWGQEQGHIRLRVPRRMPGIWWRGWLQQQEPLFPGGQ